MRRWWFVRRPPRRHIRSKPTAKARLAMTKRDRMGAQRPLPLCPVIAQPPQQRSPLASSVAGQGLSDGTPGRTYSLARLTPSRSRRRRTREPGAAAEGPHGRFERFLGRGAAGAGEARPPTLVRGEWVPGGWGTRSALACVRVRAREKSWAFATGAAATRLPSPLSRRGGGYPVRPRRGRGRVGSVGAICAGAGRRIEVGAELAIVPRDVGDGVSGCPGDGNSSTFGG